MADSWNGLMQHAVTVGDLLWFIAAYCILTGFAGIVVKILAERHERKNS
jgi:hypothetical protein